MKTLFLLMSGLTLAAQTFGGLHGTITDKVGEPIPNATITVERVDITAKPISTNSKSDGTYRFSGLLTKEFKVTYSAKGYLGTSGQLRIPPVDSLRHDVVLLLPGEDTMAEASDVMPDASLDAKVSGAEAFNRAIALHAQKQDEEALSLFDKACASFNESIGKAKDETEKQELTGTRDRIERAYGLILFEIGKRDESRRIQVWQKAYPLLQVALERLPESEREKRGNVLTSLVEISRAMRDPVEGRKYADLLDALLPPNSAEDYNQSLDAFNAGKLQEAKSCLLRALSKTPKDAKLYYQLGIVEYSLGNPIATKTNFQTYLELDPQGEKADEIRTMLWRELSSVATLKKDSKK